MRPEQSKILIQRRVLIGAILVVVCVVGFGQLPIRVQGRIVEVVTFGEWPLEWAIRRHFTIMQPELTSIIDFTNEAPEITRLSIVPIDSDDTGGLRAKLQENKFAEHDLDKPNTLQALQSVEAKFVDVRDDRVSVVMGIEERGSTTFHVAYVHSLSKIEMPSCEDFNRRERAKIGACGFRLSDIWLVVYQWEPSSLDDLEQAIQELEDNTAADGSPPPEEESE